jgi:hypothetical protein
MIGQKVKVVNDHPHRPDFIGTVTSQCLGGRWHIEVMKVDFKRPKPAIWPWGLF